MATISSLVVELKLMADNFNNQIRTAQKEAKELEKVIKPTKEAITDLGTAMTATGAAIIGTFAAITKEAADYGDAMRDAEIRTGAATQVLAGWKIAAEQTGTSFEDLQTGLKKFAVNVNAAAEGSKKQADLFKQLGVSVTDAQGQIKPMNSLLSEVSDKFKMMPDGIQKTAMMVELFGKNGANLNEFLSLGSKGLAEFQEKAEKLGLAIGADAAAAGDKFNDTLNDLKAAALGLSLTIGTSLLPMVTNVAVAVSNGVVSFRQFIEQHHFLIDVAIKLGAIMGTGGTLLLGLVSLLTILPKITTAWAALNAMMAANPVGFVIVAITTLITALVMFRNEIAGGLAKAYAFLLSGLASIVDAAARAAHALGMNGLGNTLSSAGNAIRGFANNLADMGKQLLANEPAVIDNTAAIERYKQQHQKLPPVIQETTGAVEKNSAAFKAQMDIVYKVQMGLYAYHMALAKLADDTELLQAKNGDLLSSMKVPELPTLPPVGGRPINVDNSLPNTAVIELSKAMSDAQERANNLAEKIRELRNAGYDDATITAFLASQLDQAAENAQKFHTKLDPVTQDLINQTKSAQALKDAVASVKESAGKIFDDLLINGKSVFSSLKNMLKGGALSLGRAIFEDVTGALLGPVKKAFDDFFKSLIESAGIKNFLSQLGNRIGGTLGSLLGAKPGVIMNATNVGTTAAQTAGQAASTASSGAGSAGSAASSIGGAIGTINMVSGIAGAVGSIATAIGTRRLEGTMNAVEYNTRASMIHLYFILTDTTAHIRDTMFEVKDLLVEIAGDAGELLDGFKRFYDKSFAGPAVASSTAVQSPASAGPSTVYNTFAIENVNVELTGDSFDDTLAVRKKLLPKIIEAVKLDSGGAGTALKEALGV